MTLQQNLNIDFKSEELVTFVTTHTPGQSLSVAPTFPAGFDASGDRVVGASLATVWYTLIEEWAIAQGRVRPRLLARKKISIFAAHPIAVEMRSHLAIRAKLQDSDIQAIKSAFSGFDQNKDGDPNDYVADKLRAHPSVTRDMFKVLLGYSIKITGDAVLDDRERVTFLNSFHDLGHIVTDKTGGTEGLQKYLEKEEIYPFKVQAKAIIEPGYWQDVSDSSERVETKSPSDRRDALRKRAKQDAPDCSETETEDHDIADLLHWIEIKIVWSERRIDLGCGAYLTFQYPEFRSREVAYYLVAALTAPSPVDNYVKKAVMNCLWSSVLAATVVGVALWNPKAALIAFKALFAGCVIAKFETAIDCINVDLILETRVVVDWH